MKLIILALLTTNICLFAQQPAATSPANPNVLTLKAMVPKSPATLAAGEKVTITFNCKIPGSNPVRISPAPYKGGQMVPSHSVTGATRDPGDGETQVQLSFKNAATIDEVRVDVYDSKTDKVIGTTKIPVRLTWAAPALSPSATPQPK